MNSNGNTQNSISKQNKLCKTVVILGSSETGKTNILQRYTKRRFENNYMETIEINSAANNLILSIWDTCGNELELKILPSNVYRVSSAYIIVCSYDKRDSYDMLKSWISHVQYYLNNNTRNVNTPNSAYLIPIIILINKCDIKRDRKFTIKDVHKVTNEFTLDILVYEVSAKENLKLDHIFEKVAGFVSGKVSISNETFNTTIDEDDDGIMIDEKDKRRKSFKLRESKVDRGDRGNQGSCCNKSK